MVFISRRSFTNCLQNKTKRCPLARLLTGSSETLGRKFDEILSFHNGVAAVRENGVGAYHIDQSGTPLYPDYRYKRTFGFYAAQRAAVMDFDDKFFHIDLTGRPVYADRYSWCGNFHQVREADVFRSPVRDFENQYYYIDQHGEIALGPFSYAGDPNSVGHSVVHDLHGNPMIIDVYGKEWCMTSSSTESNFIEALVPHKGIALVRDGGGWFYIDQTGREVGSGERYLFAEPHYNGQARVRFRNGQWGVVDEDGKLLLSLGESMLSSAVELESVSKRYWESLALKKILENGVLRNEYPGMPSSSTSKTFQEILKDCAKELGLLGREHPGGTVDISPSHLLNRGLLLSQSLRDVEARGVTKIMEERCRYWLQDRYLQAWLDCPQQTPNRDTFADLADDPKSVERSHRVLKSYADADWEGAGIVLSKLLAKIGGPGAVRAIVDMGGGHGSLLKEVQGSGLFNDTEEFICVDRPEVVADALASQSLSTSSSVDSQVGTNQHIKNGRLIKFEAGDLFDGPSQKANLYLMSRVLHDWPDHKASAILKRLYSTSPEDALLCVIDRVFTPANLHALLSMHMFALQESRERNHKQWYQLFKSSGWRIDGREQFNGHEMYMLTKTSAPMWTLATVDDGKKSVPKFETGVTEGTTVPKIRKAVITTGGLGTRMAPQSSVTPKALLPVISREHHLDDVDPEMERWKVRPALSYILDQFRDVCHTVDQVYVVSTPQQIPLLESFLLDYNRRKQVTGSKELNVQIVTQHSPKGFGDAVLAARQAIGDEPFVLAIGDHVYSADCVKRMLAAYQKLSASSSFCGWRKTALTGAMLCNESEVRDTGLLSSNKQSEYRVDTPWLVRRMVEKPKSNFGSYQVSVGGSVKYPSQLGIDILPPSIFTLLQNEKDQIIASGEEVDLRKVLRESLQTNGCLFGCLIGGHRLDIGNPKAYFKSLQAIASDTDLYQPPKLQLKEVQDHDEILRSVRALQQENSDHIPATLRHALFSTNNTGDCMSDEIHIGSSPGRMDLMCGFADHSGSYAISQLTAERVVSLAVVADSSKLQSNGTEQGTIRLACLQVDALSELSRSIATGNFKVRETAFSTSELFTAAGRLKGGINALSEDTSDRWEHYLVGIIHRILQYSEEGSSAMGKDFTVLTVSDLPWNAGLASSAAVEVATAIALGNALKLPSDVLEPISVSMLCKEVENRVVGAPCGILDQLAVTHPGARTAQRPLVGIRCRMPFTEVPTYSLPLPEGLRVIALESGVKRSTASSAYQSVRSGAIVGKAILEERSKQEIPYLCDMTPSQLAKYEGDLPEAISGSEILSQFHGLLGRDGSCDLETTTLYPVRAATMFPIEENYRVQVFQNVLQGLHNCAIPQESGIQVLGELMAQTHAGYGRCGLDTDSTAFLVDALRNQGAIGAKISGGGGGGAVVALVNDSFLRHSAPFEQIQERYHARTGLTCTLRKGTSGPARYHGVLRRHFSTRHGRRMVDDLPKPRVLVANHGYPPEFNGGSEVYAQMVALQLKNSGQCESVYVFAREHDPYRPDFEIRKTVDHLDGELPVFRMNYPREAPYFRFVAEEVDNAFREVVDGVKPDIVHLHHMNHLSLNLPSIAKAVGAKVLYTLHDFWLMCPRGQLLQTGPARKDMWRLCDGQDNKKCAQHCYAGRYATGATEHDDAETLYWTSWIASRMEATRDACEHIDAFIAPSQQLRDKFVNEFSLPADKVIVEPYGFFRERLANRKRRQEDPYNNAPYVFAYIGRHQPAKGINLLVDAALKLLHGTSTNESHNDIPFRVKIFGRQEQNSTRSLQRKIAECPDVRARDVFSWEAEYANKDIVDKVFNGIDCLVVPSIWEENSPLVIHEAQQSGVPVITSSHGGMGELVKDAVNGLTFEHRDADSLASAMEKALEQPAGMKHLGERGYLYTPDGQIPSIETHTEYLLKLFGDMRREDSHSAVAEAASSSWYSTACAKTNTGPVKHESAQEAKQHSIEYFPAPWRVTFDTNPDDCNFKCTMCEQHSEFSPHQKRRKESGVRKRRMDFEIIRDTVAQLAPKGLKEIIPSTMGEPLYYKHFEDILLLCHEHDIRLNLTTNGSFYGGGVEYWAPKIIPVGSDVKFSWNGITNETQEKIMKGSKLDTQIDNLRKFIKLRNGCAEAGGNYCSVTLQLTFMEVNLEELPDLVKFAIAEDCDRVKGHHLWAHFSEIKHENLRRSKESAHRWNSVASKCREIAVTHCRPSGRPFRLENFSDLDDPHEEESRVSTLVDDQETMCPFLGREAWVNHSGRFDPCCAPDEQRLSLGSFGNITEDETSLLDIWTSDQYNDLVQNYTKRSLCKNCNMRRPVT